MPLCLNECQGEIQKLGMIVWNSSIGIHTLGLGLQDGAATSHDFGAALGQSTEELFQSFETFCFVPKQQFAIASSRDRP
jgi:hypothetical protein